MGSSDERRKLRDKKKATKEARMRGEKPKSTSVYALKRKGQYPLNSPFNIGGPREGNFGQRMRKLREQPPIQPTPHCRGWAPEPAPILREPGLYVEPGGGLEARLCISCAADVAEAARRG
jgi:hypothetical protein